MIVGIAIIDKINFKKLMIFVNLCFFSDLVGTVSGRSALIKLSKNDINIDNYEDVRVLLNKLDILFCRRNTGNWTCNRNKYQKKTEPTFYAS